MQTRLVSVIFALACGLTLPAAHARLGADERSLVKRYGPVRSRGVEQEYTVHGDRMKRRMLYFLHSHWQIAALPWPTGAHKLWYSLVDDSKPWTEEQVAAVLGFNEMTGFKWTELPSRNPKRERKWRRDCGATAVWTPAAMVIEIAPPSRLDGALKRKPQRGEGNRDY
jgi:hypothetical protein